MVVIAAVDDQSDLRMVEEGATLAEAFDDDLHVVHVLRREDVEDESASGRSKSALERAEDQATDIASRVTDDFVPVGRIGRPAQELDAYAGEVDARYVVVGGRKRTPIGKALFGSVTQSVLLSVDIPVLAIRNDGE